MEPIGEIDTPEVELVKTIRATFEPNGTPYGLKTSDVEKIHKTIIDRPGGHKDDIAFISLVRVIFTMERMGYVSFRPFEEDEED